MANGVKWTRDEIIKQFIDVHGNKYNYDKVEYKGVDYKVIITCPIHGDFEQSPYSHWKMKQGCPKCAVKNNGQKHRLTQEQFIERANKIHDNKYNYSKSIYVDCNTKMCIICPIHGEFWQNPITHLTGRGCRSCGYITVANKTKYSKEWFVEKSRKIHGDKYDYSKVNYKNTKTKVCIICPEHGEFWQEPSSHFINGGCLKCGLKETAGKHRKSQEQFIEESIAIHGQKYDYSKVEYKNSDILVNIICPDHGEFWQRPAYHIKGGGCPKCLYKGQSKLFHILCDIYCNTKILYEYSPEWLGMQRFDIYFEDHNIAVEYHGIQHYEPIKYFGGEEKFKQQLEWDGLKLQKCNDNNCKLFVLKYDYTDDEFEKLLHNINLIIK